MTVEQQLRQEQMLRTRADDRAEIGDHLHDSVLQTLALIQQRAAEPDEVAHLARRQERELRRWIDQMSSGHERSFRAALRDAASEVEDRHRVRVEVVVVGDRELDAAAEAAIKAAGEALVNAAKHSGQAEISVYAEASASPARIYVRDRGPGFDPAAVPDGHRGIRDSIVGRMERHGGHAVVRSEAGKGTEVEILIGGDGT
jgi:signal transduction histidine kinase